MRNELIRKLIHYELNMEYSIYGLDIEQQTEIVANNIINNFCHEYGTSFGKKTFIYQYQDDLYSLIGYRILKNINSMSDFKFVLYGKPRKTKKYISKSDRIFSKKEFKQYKDSAILISSYNPIYKVLGFNNKSNDFNSGYKLLAQITPNQLFTLQKFYFMTGFKDQYIKPDNSDIRGFQNWLDNPYNAVVPPNLERPLSAQDINLVWITGNDEEDIKTLQEVEQSDKINFYFFKPNGEAYINKEPSILYDQNYQAFVKNKTNIPNRAFKNINHYSLAVLFCSYGVQKNFIGNWPPAELNDIMNKINNNIIV